MASSTSHRGSLNTRLLGVLLLGLIGAPLIWLTMLQTGYVLAYQACDDRSSSWVIWPTAVAVGIGMGIAVMTLTAKRRAQHERIPMPFIGWIAIGMAMLMVIVLSASAIAPLVLYPCD
jgi:hypothetical protein